MSRSVDSTLATELTSASIIPVVLAKLVFRTATRWVWTGVGTLVWDAQSFIGIGSFGDLGTITEGTDIKADGTSITLSGIDPVMLGEALGDVQLGAPATIWLGALAPDMTLIGTPYLIFQGSVDKPIVSVGVKTCTITLALENKMINHARASQRKYTCADQHANGYPTDSAFNWVEMLNDQALIWGS